MTRLNERQAHALGLMPGAKQNKYHARKIEVDGILFHSRKEARKYQELRLLKMAGEITEIKLQPVFELQPAFKRNGKVIRAITYTADFKVTYPDGRVVVIDTKGVKTQQYVLRKKMLLFKFPEIEFREE